MKESMKNTAQKDQTDAHFSSRMLAMAGGLMIVSAVLMAISTRLSIGGIFLAAAACLFFAAYHFRQAEDKKEEKTEESDNE